MEEGSKRIKCHGDTNLDFLKWSQPDPVLQSMVDRVKIEIETLGFHQLIPGATRTWPNQPDSNLDQLWMNTPERLVTFKNQDRAFSDHNMIMATFRTKNRVQNIHDYTMRQRKNFDLDQYKRDLASIDWTEFDNTEDLDVLNDIFEKNLLKVLETAAPLKTFQRRRNFRNWVSPEMKQHMENNDQLRRNARISGRQEDWEAFRKARNSCVKKLKKCKEDYHNKLFKKMEGEKTSKGLYNLTRELCNLKDGSMPQSFLQDGQIISKPKLMANCQIDYFSLKVKKMVQSIPDTQRNPHRYLDRALQTWEDKDAREVFEFKEISLQETASLVASMSESTALGHDEIDSAAIKQGAQHLIKQLRKIINLSLQRKILPKMEICQNHSKTER